MCGIAGFLNQQADSSAILQSMMARLRHRGPDDHGTFINDRVCLGHQRLSIIDLKTGHQPMSSTDGQLFIVFNGEIYNYVELRSTLSSKGYRFKTTSDTETILYLYAEFGEDCVRQLNGMFAFVIYDMRKGRLFAARDPFGIKPFYYSTVNDQFVFASEIKALLEYPGLPRTAEPRALAEYVLLQFGLGSRTMFSGIRKLEPAHWLSYDLNTRRIESREYWRPTYAADENMSEARAVDELRWLLHDSVRLQLRSDVPVGAYLSGGLDSSTVTCLAAEQLDGPMDSFTGAFHDKGRFDETPYAKAVAKARPNLRYHELYMTSQDFVERLPQLMYAMDEPCAGPGLFPQFFVSKLAAQHVKVVLGGQGGDEIFGGYPRYFLLYLEERVRRWLHQPWQPQRVPWTTLWKARHLLKAYSSALRKLFNQPLSEAPSSRRYFRLLQRSEHPDRYYRRDVVDPPMIEEILQDCDAIFNRPDTGSAYERATYFDLKTHLPALLQVEDRVSMAVSLESRVPLLDTRIIDLMGRIPDRMKFKRGELKYIFRQAVRPIVPPAVSDRNDKMGFPVPLNAWAKGPIKSFVMDTLLSRQARERGLFRTEQMAQMIESGQPFSRELWGALCLELWFQTFFETKTLQEIAS